MKKLNTNPPSPVEHNESAVSDSPAAGSQVPADDVVGSLDTSETAPVQQPAQPAAAEPSEPADEAFNQEEVRRLVEEAEHRGYIRGRNENIGELVDRRFGNEATSPADDDETIESYPSFLAHIRPSIWDN